MSKSEKKKQGTNESQEQEKVLTRYDLKMQRRAEQKRKDARDKKIATAVGIALLAALVCLIASFPIRNWLTVHGTYIVVAGENVSKVEFDYNYNLTLNNYMNSEEAYYLAYFGIDLTGDLSRQMYSDTLTWKDYIEQLTVDNLLHNKALAREMKAAGFNYDTSEDYQEYVENMRQAASNAGMTLDAYVKGIFGSYATMSRIENYVKQGLAAAAYYDSVAESSEPGDTEILAYYEENKDSYDSVDYRLITVDAELPTEPTELADPVEETEDGEETGDDEETEYEPSEAEIEAAMAIAKTEAESKLKNLAADGELYENQRRTSVTSLLRDWLFDETRKSGDTTVIEDSTNHRYYAVEFVNRYLDQTPSADLRIIMANSGNGQAALDEWQAGAATEESFAALVAQYTSSGYSYPEGGLYEGMTSSGMPEEMADWTSDSSRQKGDTTVIASEDTGTDFVVYYVGAGDPEWKLSISSILLSETMTEYMDKIIEGMEVKDPHKNLHYLEVQAQEEAQGENDSDDESDGADAADGEGESDNSDETNNGDDSTSAE